MQILKEGTTNEATQYKAERGCTYAPISLPIDRTDRLVEFDGFGLFNAEIEVALKINHDGEVKRARYMPQDSSFIATKLSSAKVIIFNYAKLSTLSKDQLMAQSTEQCPELRLHGHTKEGYGLSWNPDASEHILSASDDHAIGLWNILKTPTQGKFVDPLAIWSGHIVEILGPILVNLAPRERRTDLIGTSIDQRSYSI